MPRSSASAVIALALSTVSVMGFSRDELATLVEAVGVRDEVALIELNVSCPNVDKGGLEIP